MLQTRDAGKKTSVFEEVKVIGFRVKQSEIRAQLARERLSRQHDLRDSTVRLAHVLRPSLDCSVYTNDGSTASGAAGSS